MKTINATLCYIQKNDKTLMLYRNKKDNDIHEGKWNGLGGKLEKGESPEECVVREVLEESGLSLLNQKLAGIITFPNFDGKHDWIVYLYKSDSFIGNIVDSNEGTLEWIDTNQLLNLNLWAGDKVFLKWMLEGKFFSAKFNYSNGELIDYKVVFY